MEKNTKMSRWDWFKLLFIDGWIFFKLNEEERKEILEKVKKVDIEDINTLRSAELAISVILVLGIVLYTMFK